MGRILCATRGGEASFRAQDAAIALAQERGDELLFLYVVDIGFLQKTERAVRPDVVKAEMEKMGEFLLAMAQERAQKQGVKASYALCHGDLCVARSGTQRNDERGLLEALECRRATEDRRRH